MLRSGTANGGDTFAKIEDLIQDLISKLMTKTQWLLLFTLVVVTASRSILVHLDDNSHSKTDLGRLPIFCCGSFVCLFGVTHIFYAHVSKTITAGKSDATMKLACINAPTFLAKWRENRWIAPLGVGCSPARRWASLFFIA